MASRKRVYDAESREGAVRIVTETGRPIPEVAEDSGIHPGSLRKKSDPGDAQEMGGRRRQARNARLVRYPDDVPRRPDSSA
ncbi:transposase [Streptomyces caeni]|uniref:Transposase n=1 Tax=Streptomyces caeni TaxID=2307231 RepID=A0ABW4J1L0_9ACTN